jgi:hypothetical protein
MPGRLSAPVTDASVRAPITRIVTARGLRPGDASITVAAVGPMSTAP